MTQEAWNVLIGVALACLGAISLDVEAEQRHGARWTALKFSNMRCGRQESELGGVKTRLERQRDGALSREVAQLAADAGRTYRLDGTISEGLVLFTAGRGNRSLRFKRRIEKNTLLGSITTRFWALASSVRSLKRADFMAEGSEVTS